MTEARAGTLSEIEIDELLFHLTYGWDSSHPRWPRVRALRDQALAGAGMGDRYCKLLHTLWHAVDDGGENDAGEIEVGGYWWDELMKLVPEEHPDRSSTLIPEVAGGAVQNAAPIAMGGQHFIQPINEGRQGSESLRGPSRESSAPESVADCPAVSSPINAAPQEKASVNLPELRGCLVSAGPTSREADEVPKVRLIADQAAVNSPAVAAPLALLREALPYVEHHTKFGTPDQKAIAWLAKYAALAASGPERRKVQRRALETSHFEFAIRKDGSRYSRSTGSDRRQSAPRPDWIAQVIRDVSELPDRNSPDDAPELMLVAPQELRAIIERLAPRPDTQPGEVVVPPSPLPWRMVLGDSNTVLGIQNAHGHFILRAGKDTREEVVAYIVATVNAAPSGRAT